MTTGRLESIFLFPRSRAPGRAVESVEACASKGLLGDRRRGVKRQVTLLAAEDWAAAVGEVGGMAPAEDRRANLLVSGLPLGPTIGRRLRIGTVVVHVGGETAPCARMDEVLPGLRRALGPGCRGGVFGTIVVGGFLQVGDRVEPAE
ncbi:MAG TPA: MOSC domain-containing protein [Polyangia bacterium]|nr:MOSC domain-containing protein [Polyangia bacterium]